MNKEKIIIFVIDNRGAWPDYFCMDLLNLYETTKTKYPNTKVQTVRANSVNEMRNFSCRYAMGKIGINGEEPSKYDYVVQLDTDHRYSPNFIIDLMKHKKDIVTGCTSSRHSPFYQTQFREIIGEIRSEENIVNPSSEDGLIKIEGSGPVGMLINVKVLDKLKYPYYKIQHIGNEEGRKPESTMGGDIFFTKQLKKAGIDVWLDSNITFPHNVPGVFVNRGQIVL